MNDVLYTKSNWENFPSTNTPFYADRLNNMDKGINDCANRADASIPIDNILNAEDAESATLRDNYVYDAIDMKPFATRIGTNKINGNKNNYTIKNDSADYLIPLGNYTLVKVADISPQTSGSEVVESSITFNATSIPNFDKMTSDDFFVAMRNCVIRIYIPLSEYVKPSIIFNSQTGIGKINGIVRLYGSTHVIYNVTVFAKTI